MNKQLLPLWRGKFESNFYHFHSKIPDFLSPPNGFYVNYQKLQLLPPRHLKPNLSSSSQCSQGSLKHLFECSKSQSLSFLFLPSYLPIQQQSEQSSESIGVIIRVLLLHLQCFADRVKFSLVLPSMLSNCSLYIFHFWSLLPPMACTPGLGILLRHLNPWSNLDVTYCHPAQIFRFPGQVTSSLTHDQKPCLHSEHFHYGVTSAR